MIGFLTGQIAQMRGGAVILDVAGVGYQVYVSPYTLGHTAGTEGAISFYIHTHVREQEITLYGFLSEDELTMFELLIGISGIGPKAALNILTVADPETLRSAITNKDTSILTKVSGIGKRTAEKVILELENKVTAPQSTGGSVQTQTHSGAIDALVAMGYSVSEARDALKDIPKDITDTGEVVRLALQQQGT